MDFSTEAQVLNLIDRFGQGVVFEDDEEGHIISDLDEKLVDLSRRMADMEAVLEQEITENKDGRDSHSCELNSVALNCFLNNVVQAVESNTSKEDKILSDFINYCQQNNLAIPSVTPNVNDDLSIVSLNMCIDETEERTARLWNKVTTKFKNGIANLMKKLPQTNSDQVKFRKYSDEYIKCIHKKRLKYFELLCFILSFREVFDMYCSVREEELKAVILEEAQFLSTDKIARKKEIVEYIIATFKTCRDMLLEDNLMFKDLSQTSKEHIAQILQLYSYYITKPIKWYLRCFDTDNLNSSQGHTVTKQEYTNDAYSYIQIYHLLHAWSIICESVEDVAADETQSDLDISNGIKLKHVFDKIDPIRNSFLYDFWEHLSPMELYMQKITPLYVQDIFNGLINRELSNQKYKKMKICLLDKYLQKDQRKWQPFHISMQCSSFATRLNELMIFVQSSSRGGASSLNKVIVNAILDGWNSYLAYVKETLHSFIVSAMDVHSYYQLTADLLFIKSQIHLWDQTLMEDGDNLTRQTEFSNVHRIYESICNQAIKGLKDYHIRILKTSLAYDAHSNDWGNDKPFFEIKIISNTWGVSTYITEDLNSLDYKTERIRKLSTDFKDTSWSSLQRLTKYTGMIHDIHGYLPDEVSKEAVKDVTMEIMTFYAARYLSVKPSYRRVKQAKGDILALMAITRWLVLYLADDVDDVMGEESSGCYLLHELCISLAENMVVMSAPFSLVANRLSEESPIVKGEQIKWMHLVDSPESSSEENVMFDILMKQVRPDMKLLLKFLTSGNVIDVIIENIGLLKESVEVLPNVPDNIRLSEMFIIKSSDEEVEIRCVEQKKFLKHLFVILSKSSRQSFLQFMGIFIKSDNSKSFKEQSSDQFPIWLELISDYVRPMLKRIFAPAFELLMYQDEIQSSPCSTFFTTLETLPCGCDVAECKDEKLFNSTASLLYNCLMITIRMLVENIQAFPEIFWFILGYIKEQESFTPSWIQQQNLGTKILAGLMFSWLSTTSNFEYFSYYTGGISDKTFTNIKDFAELLWHVVFNLTHDVTDNPKISMSIFKDLQNSSQEIQEKLSILSAWCNQEKVISFDEGDMDVQVDFMDAMALSESEDDKNILNNVYSVLKTNEKLVRRLLNSIDTADIKDVVVDDGKVTLRKFNPIIEYQMIGNSPLNHMELLDKEFDWESLLAQISTLKIKTLVWNRFEMQEDSGGFLTEEEKELAGKLMECLKFH